MTNRVRLRDRRAQNVEFAKAMRRVDPSIQLSAGAIALGGAHDEVAGEHLQFVAHYHMFNPDAEKQPCCGAKLPRDAAATWQQLMKAWEITDEKIRATREQLGRQKNAARFETEFTSPFGRDRGDVNSTWATGVSYARILNNHQRHGDVLKIATAADFCGTRWQNNALMIPVPQGQGRAYLQPVARVMKLYRHHIGTDAVSVKRTPDTLDVAASRSGDTVFLHVVNTERTRAVKANFQIEGESVAAGGRVFEMVDDPMVEVTYLNSAEVMRVVEKPLSDGSVWEFPAASVSVVELKLAPAKPSSVE